ncbi:MAG: radical SAM protein [Nitrospiraceae bacterium]|nr:MAG: radical SAM protein [Nitrospiraceae bacterium]
MNILLINPDLSVSERYGMLAKVGPTTEPMGLTYIAAVLLERGHKVRIIDAAPIHFKPSDLAREIEKEKFDLVGITFMTPMYLCAMDVAKSIRKANREITIVIGGPHVTIMPEETLKNNREIDFAVLGEGEYTMLELVDALEKGANDFTGIKGIAFLDKENKFIITPPREPEKDIDKFPLPARHLLPMKLYRPTPTYYQKLPAHIILTTRGCPFRCSYCSKIFGNLVRFHSVERIIKEINILIEEHGAKEIIFRDDTFTINKKHTTQLCNEMIKQGIHKKIRWMCMTRVNLIDEELLKIMKKAGCWSMHFGVESGSQRLLDLVRKDITIEQIKKAFYLTKKVGIKTKAFFMIGLPTETPEESLLTIGLAKELDPDGAQFTITVPFPGTKLFDLAKTSGHMKSFRWEDYQSWAGWTNKDLVYVTEGRTQEELKQFQKRALREFYLRPGMVFRNILAVRSLDIFRAYFHGGLALLRSALNKN